jgi:hypothetical protein
VNHNHIKIKTRYINFILIHHLFFTSGKISDKAKYSNAHAIIAMMTNLFANKKSVNGNSVSAQITHPRAAMMTNNSFL